MDTEATPIMSRLIDFMEPSFASSVADETSVHHNIDNLIYEDESFNKFADILQHYEIDEGRVNRISKVSDIFNNVILKQLWKEKGSPFIKMLPGAGRSNYGIDERTEAYNPFESKTQPVDTMNLYSYLPESSFMGELAHADQYKRKEGESMFDWKMRRMNLHNKSTIESEKLGEEAYQTPGAQEWEAHKIKEQELYEHLPAGFNLSGSDSLFQRMKRRQWDLWKDELKNIQKLQYPE